MTHRLIILAKSLAVEFEFKGQPVVVITNHLKSKIGDDAYLWGKPTSSGTYLANS